MASQSFDYSEARRLLGEGLTQYAVAASMGVTRSAIAAMVKRGHGAIPDGRHGPRHKNLPEREPTPPRHTYATVEAMVAQGIPRREAMRQFHARRV